MCVAAPSVGPLAVVHLLLDVQAEPTGPVPVAHLPVKRPAAPFLSPDTAAVVLLLSECQQKLQIAPYWPAIELLHVA